MFEVKQTGGINCLTPRYNLNTTLMKKILIGMISLLALASCHNYAREQADNQAKTSADSARTADSLRHTAVDSSERANFHREIRREIDSMETRLAYMDSVNAADKKTGNTKWVSTRNDLNSRLERLKIKEKQADQIAKERWAEFKQEVDTAIQNIKYEWKNGE